MEAGSSLEKKKDVAGEDRGWVGKGRRSGRVMQVDGLSCREHRSLGGCRGLRGLCQRAVCSVCFWVSVTFVLVQLVMFLSSYTGWQRAGSIQPGLTFAGTTFPHRKAQECVCKWRRCAGGLCVAVSLLSPGALCPCLATQPASCQIPVRLGMEGQWQGQRGALLPPALGSSQWPEGCSCLGKFLACGSALPATPSRFCKKSVK